MEGARERSGRKAGAEAPKPRAPDRRRGEASSSQMWWARHRSGAHADKCMAHGPRTHPKVKAIGEARAGGGESDAATAAVRRPPRPDGAIRPGTKLPFPSSSSAPDPRAPGGACTGRNTDRRTDPFRSPAGVAGRASRRQGALLAGRPGDDTGPGPLCCRFCPLFVPRRGRVRASAR